MHSTLLEHFRHDIQSPVAGAARGGPAASEIGPMVCGALAELQLADGQMLLGVLGGGKLGFARAERVGRKRAAAAPAERKRRAH